MPALVDRVVQRHKNAARELNPSVVETAARKVIRKVPKRGGRKAVIKDMVKALSGDDLVMEWFHYLVEWGGGFNYQNTQDLLGEALADWKEDKGIDDYDSEWEDLSSDSDLVKGLKAAVAKWKPKANMASPKDYGEVEHLASRLLNHAERLYKGRSYDEAKDEAEALDFAEKIVALLKK